MKKKLLLSILSIVMCFSLITGATFALFTSESTVNVAVTSGKVKVVATAENFVTYSGVYNEETEKYDSVKQNGLNFALGGNVINDGNTVSINKILPMDKVTFDLRITNNSDVVVKYQTAITFIEGAELFEGLKITIGEDEYDGLNRYTKWTVLEPESEDIIVPVVIELPYEAGNEFQGLTTKIAYTVNAVQGNANVQDPFVLTYNDGNETKKESFVDFAQALNRYNTLKIGGDYTIKIADGTYYNTAVTIEQFKDRTLTIQGSDNVVFVNKSNTPVIFIDGNSNYDTLALAINNVNFELEGENTYAVQFGSGSNYRYASEITFTGCDFYGVNGTGIAVQSGNDCSAKNIKFENCTAKNIETFITAYVDGLTVSNCVVSNVNKFVNNQVGAGHTTISNCQVTIDGEDADYGVRVKTPKLNVIDSEITLVSKQDYSTAAVVVRSASTVTIMGSTLTASLAQGVNGFACQICEATEGIASITTDKDYTLCVGYEKYIISIKDYDKATDTITTRDGSYIFNVAGLKELATQVNNGNKFSGKTIKLLADIDLNNEEWTPIGNSSAVFDGDFDGQNHTISNLKVTKNDRAGLFGAIQVGVVKNVNINNAEIKSNHYAGALVAWGYVDVDNCHVTNVTVECSPINSDDNGDKAGALVGWTGEGCSSITNCTVTNSTVSGYRDVGGVVGMAHTNCIVTGNAVNNVEVNYISSNEFPASGNNNKGFIIGRYSAGVIDENNKVNGVKTYSTADALAAALTANEQNIEVLVARNIDLPITKLGSQTLGSGEYKLGGEKTQTIKIDLCGNTLNITTTYWSAIGAVNADATITLKNGSITSTGNSAGTWNAWDIRLSNCNYDIEDVNFLKAVALDNAGKITNMKNVAITDSHNTDTYGLWITAEGQTVNIDGLTMNMTPASDGRGIKIDNQYVDNSSKVTLNVKNATFVTEEKAAIIVKSPAGADITLENVDIAGVVEDSVNVVWVDEDAAAHADLVKVNGQSAVIEGQI